MPDDLPANRPADAAAAEIIRRNLAAVRDGVAEACRRAGRRAEEVTIVGVTKYVAADAALLLAEAGMADLGESRPQSLWEKCPVLAAAGFSPRWHLIGHLQRNKVRRTLPLLGLLHSLDSLRLLEAVEAEARAAEKVVEALVELNLAADPDRTGASEAEAERIVAAAARSPHVRLRGLMGMATAPDDDAGAARRQFARLREFRDALAARIPEAEGLAELSMGMSGDYAAAILEGSTLVRIGSALWEGVAPRPRHPP
jgi:pyridoxal phosphate enzyme (YggS family)